MSKENFDMKEKKEIVPMILSTPDNPYDPFKDFELWYAYDEEHGHHTSSYVARLTNSSDTFSEDQQQLAVNEAVRKIFTVNPQGMYVIYFGDGRVEKFDNELSRSLINDARSTLP